MWPRVVEMMLGLWLLSSPFIFRHNPDELTYWRNDLTCGFLVMTLSMLSYSPSFRLAHLVTGSVGLWLIGFGFFSARPVPPALQNDITVGMVLVMIALIPNEASLPPRGWRRGSER